MTIEAWCTPNEVPFYELSKYTMVERESQPEEDTSVQARIHRLTKQYQETGVRRSIDAVLIVTVSPPDPSSPDLSSTGSHTFSCFKSPTLSTSCKSIFTQDRAHGRPGGYLDPTETDAEGIMTRLDEQLGVPIEHSGEGNKYEPGGWKVRECLSAWWRPNFDTFLYPYLPPHITEPKECKKLYLIELPPSRLFGVPSNMKLHAIPVFEFYDNAARYGPQFAGLPYMLSPYLLPRHKRALKVSTQHTAYGDVIAPVLVK